MKTLFISDLDGTLLNKNALLSEYTTISLNKLIEKGIHFSVATARTAATVITMLENVKINVPIVLMNGVCIYDIHNKEYVKVEYINYNAKKEMFDVLNEYKMSGFVYTIDKNNLATYYENTDSPNALAFIEERVRKYKKPFTKVNSIIDCLDFPVVYYSVSDKKEKLVDAYDKLKQINGIHIEFYRDIYNEDFWYMEICSVTASKYNAVRFLQKEFHFEKTIGFGDNLNDLPLFLACDECYAVDNAKPEVKDKATSIIKSNNDDGVVKKIEELFI